MAKRQQVNKELPSQDLMTINGEAPVTDLLRLAVEKLGGEGAESVVAAIERLVDLKMKVDEHIGEQQFNEALAQFQDECPPIKKSSVAKVVSKSGTSSYSYKYAELDEIARTVKPFLFHRGFSFNWDSETTDNIIKATCYLRHHNGHSISSTFQAPVPDALGSMNDIQRHAAVLTYVKRQSLVEVLGLTTTEADTDGVSPETITKQEALDLQAMAEEIGVDIPKFLKYMDVDDFEKIRKAEHKKAIAALEQKKKKKAEKKAKPAVEGELL